MAAVFTRRGLLGSLAATATLTACGTPTPAPTPPPSAPAQDPSPSPSLDTPFGMAASSRVEVAVFDGGYGTDFAGYVARAMQDRLPGVTVGVTALDRMDVLDLSESPPDVVHNAGPGALPVSTILDQLEALDDLIQAENLEGTVIRDTLHGAALAPGTFDGTLVAINYVLTVYAFWYSASLFESRGWGLPTTWDGILELGTLAKAEGRYLFAWSPEAATAYLELVIASAIKEGGDEVRIALDSLAEGAWSQPAVVQTFAALEKCVRQGLVQPADPDAGLLATQATWSLEGRSLLYPSGAWIEHEMLAHTAEGFRMTCGPVPTLTSSPTMPPAAVHATAAEPFFIPKAAGNVPGGKEFLRTMLSPDAAAHFAMTNLVPTVVKNTVPTDAGATSLGAQTRLLADAGEYVFSWRFVSHYGLEEPFGQAMTRFLSAELTTPALVAELQRLTDEVRANPEIEVYAVE
ncbi:MAG TPA: N-acetylglucosamine/diacetylchitobiose ABC transporter substrate-binding protein [Arachnia sp.]|nr:N-acetylglucosamine/diacetylchitobiose ABC transporter substrate-binding protein [Arachnia sp.]HMT86175.1 N-acetylglucosamine/diacetylchitobiose ABC transporter substrate-binding protein [Arachnia sp.]